MLGIVYLTLQSYINENRAASLSVLLYSAMFKDSPFTVELAESYNVGALYQIDPYLAAGRADPHSAAVCRESQIKEGPVKLATGALVNIKGRPVVITTATFENPVQVEFFGIAATLGACGIKYGLPKNRLDRVALGLAVGGWSYKVLTRDSTGVYSLLGYQNLRSQNVQEWLNQAVPALPTSE